MQTTLFERQITRKDVLTNMLRHVHLSGSELFQLIMNETNATCNETRQGWLFETLSQILIMTKCMGIDYTEIYDGQLQSLKQVKNIRKLLNIKIDGGGNNIVDMAIKQDSTFILFSMKYNKKYKETDVSKIDNTVKTQNIMTDYKLGLIVKEKTIVTDHKYKNKHNIDKQLHDVIISNGMLFDSNDVIKGLEAFCRGFSHNTLTTDEFIENINDNYLGSCRKQLVQKLHQRITLLKFKQSIANSIHTFCIAHKPRSGKSITMLLICKYLLENDYKKILIMTSVPATIQSFIDDLEKYIDFKDISYKTQEDFATLDKQFQGIVFCSVQYLKMDGKNKKKAFLKEMGFDAMIVDESHQGSSTDKTKTGILEVDGDVESIRQTIRLKIFASGTATKTRAYYKIPGSAVSEWEMVDEAHMKQIFTSTKKDDILAYMINRHGPIFTECLSDATLNKDYSKHPIQVLMKHSIPQKVIDQIKEYNRKTGLEFGYNSSSLFALQQALNEKGELEYREAFELCKDNDGIDILKGFLECFISQDRMEKNTIMKHIENTQSSYRSRKSTVEHPLLFLVYLPTHTRNNTIALLQKTLKQFLEDHDLWTDYNIEYSNSIEDTGHVKEEYNEYIKTIMDKTKAQKKRGCILLLGNKGTVGITYNECDVTISLDDGHNLDNQEQRVSRAFTEAEGKTIGINVDMNIQRSYMYLINVIHKYRKNTQTTKSNAEILYYLFEQNIFLFNPQEFNNGKITTVEIMSYYQKEVENIMKEIDDTLFLENIICDADHLTDLLDKMVVEMKPQQHKEINKDLEGEQQDCPKGDKTKVQIDGPGPRDPKEEEEEDQEDKIFINKTLELCKYLFPYLSLLSKVFKIFDFVEIMLYDKTKDLVISFLQYKKIDLKNNYDQIVHIMKTIITKNQEIINNIREIYSIAQSKKLRELIEKHFIPTSDEKKRNAEVPTPVILVDNMLDSITIEFWKTPKKVFEPCCGKGNFVLGIFDKFYNGLAEMYPDQIERCQVIITDCIYYADITALNVFITTEILKCHIQSYCGIDEFDFEFNSYTGDTLELDIKTHFKIDGVHAVCGNPPYNSSGDTSTGNTIWQDFTKKSLNEWLLYDGYLLFVHPPGWRKPNTEQGKYYGLYELMCIRNQMVYLEIHGIKDGQKLFHCGTRYDWYLIHKATPYKDTIIIDEEYIKHTIDLSRWSWLPNSRLDTVQKILATHHEERCPIIYNRSNYGSDNKKHISKIQNELYKYPVIHTIPLNGIRYIYSSINNKGHFGTPKVIFGDNGLNDAVIDMEGIYGMSENSMAIEVTSIDEANNIKMALLSRKFKEVIKCCIIGNFRIDWRLFREFKKDFWNEFI
jgi:hypothetical protein